MAVDTNDRRIAAVQMAVRVGDLPWNLTRAKFHLTELSAWLPDLVVFPESVLDGYACREPDLAAHARKIDSPENEAICGFARDFKTWILWTFPETGGSGIYNTSILIDRTGDIRLTYRKVHLCAEVWGG